MKRFRQPMQHGHVYITRHPQYITVWRDGVFTVHFVFDEECAKRMREAAGWLFPRKPEAQG